MTDGIETQMLNALELFHYGNRFRDKLFVLALADDVTLDALSTDLRVLEASQIHLLVIVRDTVRLKDEIEAFNRRGSHFEYLCCDGGEPAERCAAAAVQSLRANAVPVVALHVAGPSDANALISRASAVGTKLGAEKLFYLSRLKGLEVDGRLQSHASPDELAALLASAAPVNAARELVELIHRETSEGRLDVVLLEGRSGRLFEEIFTHRGKGTLFTKNYPNLVRRSTLADVMQIAMLMKPSIRAGTLLPTSDDDIANDIDSYFVFTVNGAVVAAAKLGDYGEAAELAKFSTLPRYQGKGRARQLAREMLGEARRLKKGFVFALSIEPRMWQFFQSLGFREVPRETLPDAWRRSYDFDRPSRAFRLDLTGAAKGIEQGEGD